MSGFEKNWTDPKNDMTKKQRTDAAYSQMKNAYDNDREQFIQEEISEKKGQIKEKMINKVSEQDIKKFITWEFTCINTYKKNKKIHRSGMTGKIVGTKDVHYNNPPSFREVEEIYQEIKSSLPKPLSSNDQFFLDLQNKFKAQQEAQEAAMYYDSCNSDDNDEDQAYNEKEQEEQEKEQEEKWERDYEAQCKKDDDQKKCDERKAEIEELHKRDLGIMRNCDTKRKADIRNRMRIKMGKEKVATVNQDNMTKEEAQKVIPTLELGDDIEEFSEGAGEDEDTKYKVITKSETTELHSDWRLMWKISEEYTTIKYYNPTFKLEIFDKPIKGKQQFDNEYIRSNLKTAYDNPDNTGKIIIWDPIMGNGMVNIYEKLVDNTVFPSIEKATPDIRMGWDDTKDNERPYYIYKQSYKDIVTYEPPMHLLSSFSYNIIREHGSDEKVSAAGPKQPGGKRKTRKQKQPKQKRAGSTKKTKKPKKTNNAKKGGKTSQKKGKKQKQKRGTRGKK